MNENTLYKWFRRVRGPAATQAIKTGEIISVIYDTGERQIDSSSAYKLAVMQRVAPFLLTVRDIHEFNSVLFLVCGHVSTIEFFLEEFT